MTANQRRQPLDSRPIDERPTKHRHISTAVIATIIGSLVTIAGIGATFGGYKTKVDSHGEKITVLEANMIRRDEFNAVQSNINEIRNDVKELLKGNSNTKRRCHYP